MQSTEHAPPQHPTPPIVSGHALIRTPLNLLRLQSFAPRHLVLQHSRANASLPDLSIVGAHIRVLLSNARIARLEVSNQLGEIRLDHLRTDTAVLRSADDNLAYEDDRDTALLYRSPNDAVCAAAPLVEAIPHDLQACDMNPPAAPLQAAHNW